MRKRLLRPPISPAHLGWRWVDRETVPEYLARRGRANGAGPPTYEAVHPEEITQNPLPANVDDAADLPSDPGWWGYSFRDVPERVAGETFVATLENCRVVHFTDRSDRFWAGILNDDDRALALREHHFREPHLEIMRSGVEPERVVRATWVLERVFHNYSHWLTAHLPKLLLLQEKDRLGDVLLHPDRPGYVDESMRLAGLDPDAFRTFDPGRPLQAELLTVIGSDRFRPELLRSVRDALPRLTNAPPHRKVYVSREKATRRRLVDEARIRRTLEAAGFESVVMEELPFREQVRLMQETAVLFAPHGAGLTNMLFCDPGTDVVEIADLGFPNPNFYAVAAAMGHRYWLVAGEGVGEVHPLEKDLRVSLAAVEETLAELAAAPRPAVGREGT